MIRAVFMDVDNTLYSHTSLCVPHSAREALGQLRRKGVKLYLSTGRHPAALKLLPLEGLDLQGYIVLNGQLALDLEGRELFSSPLAPSALEELMAAFHALGRPLLLSGDHGSYLTYEDTAPVARHLAQYKLKPQVGGFEGRRIYQATVFQGPEEDAALLSHLPGGCRLVRWSAFGADVISASGGKGAAMAKILEREGIGPHEALAIGDADNDVDMLSAAGLSVAMGNASPAAKAAAGYVTSHIDQDGLAQALYALGILP